jgi:hypothetical protein
MVNPMALRSDPRFSIVSILALICGIIGLASGAGWGLVLAILAILLGAIGVIMSLLPGVRGGMMSILSVVLGAIGIILAIIKFIIAAA